LAASCSGDKRIHTTWPITVLARASRVLSEGVDRHGLGEAAYDKSTELALDERSRGGTSS
jgi:hypothetical protein